MEGLRITIEEIVSDTVVKPYMFRKKFTQRWTDYKLTYDPSVRDLIYDRYMHDFSEMYVISEHAANSVIENPNEDKTEKKISELQKLLKRAFHHLPSRNPERKPVSIVVNMNMDENSRSYLDSLVRRYTQAQGVKIEIHQAEPATARNCYSM